MRRQPVLMGVALATLGVVVVVGAGVVLAREIARSPDWGPTPLLFAAGGVLLVLVGVGLIRDLRRPPTGYPADDGPAVLFPYAPPQPDAGSAGHLPTYDSGCASGGDAGGGGGGGDCGGGGGGF